jgi:hypothetical protein
MNLIQLFREGEVVVMKAEATFPEGVVLKDREAGIKALKDLEYANYRGEAETGMEEADCRTDGK